VVRLDDNYLPPDFEKWVHSLYPEYHIKRPPGEHSMPSDYGVAALICQGLGLNGFTVQRSDYPQYTMLCGNGSRFLEFQSAEEIGAPPECKSYVGLKSPAQYQSTDIYGNPLYYEREQAERIRSELVSKSRTLAAKRAQLQPYYDIETANSEQ
jgi:hypothetical protein